MAGIAVEKISSLLILNNDNFLYDRILCNIVKKQAK